MPIFFMGRRWWENGPLPRRFAQFLEKGIFETVAEGEVLQDIKVIDLAFVKQLDPDKKGDSIGIDAVREMKNFLWQKAEREPAPDAHP